MQNGYILMFNFCLLRGRQHRNALQGVMLLHAQQILSECPAHTFQQWSSVVILGMLIIGEYSMKTLAASGGEIQF